MKIFMMQAVNIRYVLNRLYVKNVNTEGIRKLLQYFKHIHNSEHIHNGEYLQ